MPAMGVLDRVADLVHHTHPRAVRFAGRVGLGRVFHNILDHTARHADPDEATP